MKKYDIIVIGSGGGSKITSPAALMGYKVACIEKGAPGGTCLNRGCIPSKMLIHPADVASEIRQAAKFDISIPPELSINFGRLVRRISKTVDTDSEKITLGYDRNPNIDYYPAEAKFLSNKVIQAGRDLMTADKIFIAVGSRPAIPNIPGLHGTPFMTSTEALRRLDLPRKMIVIGASYIAVELGYAYGALGTEVHFLVRSRFLRKEDLDISNEFTRVFSKDHHTHMGVVPVHVSFENDLFTVTCEDQTNQRSHVTADALLVATGVVPNADTLDLHKTDIQMTPEGCIRVDERLQTSVENVYAFGDCIGHYFFRHTVNFEGEYLFRTVMENHGQGPIQYPPVPHAIFSRPQVAGVGKTEEQLKAEGVDYVVGINTYAKSAMGMARLSDYGFCKILIERRSQKIIGAHIIGDEASDMIHMLIALMFKNGTLSDLLDMMYIHPALPEIVRNAARKAHAALKNDVLV